MENESNNGSNAPYPKNQVRHSSKVLQNVAGLFIVSIIIWLVAFFITLALHLIWGNLLTLSLLTVSLIILSVHLLITLALSQLHKRSLNKLKAKNKEEK